MLIDFDLLKHSSVASIRQREYLTQQNRFLSGIMNRLSTHILDISKGTPAIGIVVRLQKQGNEGQWTIVFQGITDSDGRLQLGLTQDVGQGVFKLTFLTKPYFDAINVSTLFPFVEVAFEITDTTTSLHVPLLLTPFGYMTYRGS